MNLAVWEGGGRLRLYNYNYDDSMRERMGRVLHNGITQLWENKTLCDLAVVIGGKVSKQDIACEFMCYNCKSALYVK